MSWWCRVRGHKINEYRAARTANLAAMGCQRCGQMIDVATRRPVSQQADADDRAAAELQKCPVGSVDGYREAFRQVMEDVRTPDSPCGRDEAHKPHLWRDVCIPGGQRVDEALRRCSGGEASR